MEPIGPTIRRLLRQIQLRRQRHRRHAARREEGDDAMLAIQISPQEFIRYLEWRINRGTLVPLVPWPEAIARFGRDPIVVTTDDVGQATLSSPGGRGAPTPAPKRP
jgi:hypothetical protein